MKLYSQILKRIIDIGIVLVIIPPIIIISIIISCLIYYNDKLPILYTSKRVGLGCKHFVLFKFRTMFNDKINNNYYTSINDSRVTNVGRFLRKFSLDELPQVINVLNGSMSLVGPRPDDPRMKTIYSKVDFLNRHCRKPGITGLAQVKGRSKLTQRHRLQYDLFYINHCSFKLDFMILKLTFQQILKGDSY